MAKFFKAKKNTNTQAKVVEVTTESYNHDGSSIGYINDKICFVQGALPNEKVKAQLIEDKAKIKKARVVKVIQPSQERIEAKCQHFSDCGGCQLQYVNRDSQLAMKKQAVESLFKRFAKVQKLPWEVSLTSDPWQYRRAARVGVWYDKNQSKYTVGFRKSHSKQLTAIEDCLVLTENFAAVFKQFQLLLPQLQVGPFVTHLEVLAADNVSLLVIRHTKPLKSADKQKLKMLGKKQAWFVVSEGEKGQFVGISDETIPKLSYRLAEHDIELEFNIGDFIQVNADINQQMINQALSWLDIQNDDRILDLFCGIGNFSLPLARKCQKVIGVEGVDAMVARAGLNAKRNGVENAEFFQADLSQDFSKKPASWLQQKFSKVLLDPARAGAEAMMTPVAALKPKKVLYVSCDPLTIARDSGRLIDAGYKLKKIALMDMFSHTKHVEVMALFEPK